MDRRNLVLGVDSSTQSTTAVILDRGSFRAVAGAKVRYRDDPRLARFGLSSGAPVLPPLEEGEASQPPGLFLAALDALLSDLPREALSRLAAIDLSAQQHGQVWLAEGACEALSDLRRPGAGAAGAPSLEERIAPGLAYDRAPIWMSSNTAAEADAIRRALGGPEAVTGRSGSDSPLRFSGAVLARAARLRPEAYTKASRVHLISSFLAGVLSGNPDAPVDWGNGSGTGLMDWAARAWDGELLAATAAAGGLPGGARGLAARLPPLAHPLALAGRAAAYFTERYGIPEDCAIVVSSGDNPQSKVLASGTLLSLGTSFVVMGEGRRPLPAANAMYDGLGRPFLFGCRTNGSLAWEGLRSAAGLGADDFASAERALASVAPGSVLRIVQPATESFPASPPFDLGATGSFGPDYAGAVDSALGLLALASAEFAGGEGAIAATGGAASSRGVLARAAAIFGRPVLPIADAGAAAGAAVAAACALVPEAEREGLAERARAVAARPGPAVEPDPAAVRAYRGPGGYLERLAEAFAAAAGRRI